MSHSFIERVKQQAIDKAQGDHFGRSVSISGDWEIVGASSKNNDTGAAYIFGREPSTGILIQKQQLHDSLLLQAGAHFGASVCINGDRAIVGAPGDRDGSVAGAAYVFKRNANDTWVLETSLPAPQAGDLFGFSVSINDNRAIVGAPDYDDGPGKKNAGAVYIYEVGAWTPVLLKADAPQAGSVFGYAVSISDKWAIVGAYKARDAANQLTGEAYIFAHDGIVWNPIPQKLQDSVPPVGEMFGLSVSINSRQAVVGAWGGNTPGSVGAAYIFEHDAPSGLWTKVQKLPAPTADDNFGYSVSISPSGDRVIVGAQGADTGPVNDNVGAAYLFESAGGAWNLPPQKLQACDKALDDRFGISVSVSGDRAVVGAHREDTGVANAGAAYLFELSHCGC